MTSIERTVYPQVPTDPDTKWLKDYATPTEAELQFVYQHTSDEHPELQLGLMLLLKLFQCLHYFPDVTQLPSSLTERVQARMKLESAVIPKYDAKKTQGRHYNLVYEYLGATPYVSTETDSIIETILEDAARRVNDPADLLNIVIDALLKANQELPAFGTLDEMTSTVRSRVHRAIFRAVEALLSESDKVRLDQVMDSNGPGQLSEWNLIKQPAGKASVSHLRELKKRWEEFRVIVPVVRLLSGLLKIKIVHFAAEASVLNAKRLRESDGSYTLLLCFLHQAQVTMRDDLVRMILERIRLLHKKGDEKLKGIYKQQRGLAEDLVALLAEIVLSAASTEDNAEFGQQVREMLEQGGGTGKLQTDCDQIAAHARNDYYPLLYPLYQNCRSLLFDLVETLDVQSTTHDDSLTKAIAFMLARRNLTRAWWEGDLDLSFTTERWRKHIRGTFKGKAAMNRRMLEPCVFSAIADDLLSGDLYVPHSQDFGDIRADFLPWAECLKLLKDYCERLGFDSDPAGFRRALEDELTQACLAVDEGYPENQYLVIAPTGEVTLKRLPARPAVPGAAKIHKLVEARMPERHVLDVLRTVHQVTQWSRNWGPRSGLAGKLDAPTGAYLFTTFGYGCNIGPAQTARHTRGAVSEDTMRYVHYQHLTPAKLEDSRRDVVNLFNQFDLPCFWGSGQAAAADGTHVPMYLDNLIAQYHARYRKKGGIAFHYVSDKYVALFSQFITCGVWEGVYILDIIQHNLSTIQPTTFHADTHGQSMIIFALVYLLGIDLMPRIQGWQDLKLFKPSRHAVYQHIEALFSQEEIDFDLIEKHVLDMFQVVISIQESRLLPSTILRKLGYRSRKNHLYQAFQELGKVIRTLFLLHYISDPDLRRGILTTTNKVELYHEFWQWLRFGSEGIINHNAPEEHLKRIRYTDLVANALMVQNVADTTAILRQLIDEGYHITPQILATFNPYAREHLKRFGVYSVDFDIPPETLDLTGLGIPVLPIS